MTAQQEQTRRKLGPGPWTAAAQFALLHPPHPSPRLPPDHCPSSARRRPVCPVYRLIASAMNQVRVLCAHEPRSSRCRLNFLFTPSALSLQTLFAALLCVLCTAAVASASKRASVSSDVDGNLHIRSAANQTVFVNGRDLAAELAQVQQTLQEVLFKLHIPTAAPTPAPTPLVVRATLKGCDFSAYDGVETLDGDLWVTCEPVVGMSRLRHVTGTFRLEHATPGQTLGGLSTVRGLVSLEHVGKDLLLVGVMIRDVDWLSNLKTVGKEFHIRWATVTNLDGLSSLTSAGLVSITYSHSLTSIYLSSLSSVAGVIVIHSNNVLTSITMPSLTRVDGSYIRVCGNPKLTSIPSILTTLSAGKSHSSQCLRTGSSCC